MEPCLVACVWTIKALLFLFFQIKRSSFFIILNTATEKMSSCTHMLKVVIKTLFHFPSMLDPKSWLADEIIILDTTESQAAPQGRKSARREGQEVKRKPCRSQLCYKCNSPVLMVRTCLVQRVLFIKLFWFTSLHNVFAFYFPEWE